MATITTTTEIIEFIEGSGGEIIDHNYNNNNINNNNNNNNVDIWDHQITFEIPSNVDLERIKNLDNFTTLLHKAGYNGGAGGGAGIGGGSEDNNNSGNINFANMNSDNIPGVFGGGGGKWSLTSSASTTNNFDYQILLNYLWIGVVTSLVIMSIVFIVFSCYFYRKFKEWKKCNKDIRSQLPNDLYPTGATSEDGYYQMETPPCYTIATGLPSYDEALLQAHFTFGMRFILPWENPMESNCYQWESNTSGGRNPMIDIKEIENHNNNNNNNNNYYWSTRATTTTLNSSTIMNGIDQIPPIVVSSTTITSTSSSLSESSSSSSSSSIVLSTVFQSGEKEKDIDRMNSMENSNNNNNSTDCTEVVVIS